MDLPDSDENLKALSVKFAKVEMIPVSAAKGQGIEELKRKLAEFLSRKQTSASA